MRLFKGSFRRQLPVYICAVTLPVLLLMGWYVVNLRAQTLREAEKSYDYLLSVAVNSIDEDLKAFDNIARQYSGDPLLTPYVLRQNNYETVKALKQISLYTDSVNIVDATLLCFPGDDILYTNGGICARNVYFSLLGFEDENGRRDFEAFCDGAIRGYSLASHDVILLGAMRYVAIAGAWNAGGATVGNVVGLVRTNYFTTRFRQLLLETPCTLYVTNARGRVLYGGGANATALTDALNQALEREGESSAVDAGGERYSALSLASSKIDWRFTLLLPQAESIRWMTSAMWPVIVGFALLLLVCLATSVALARKSFSPIRHISGLLNLQTKPDADELALLDQSVLHMLSENQDMRAQLEFSRRLMREQLLMKILSGGAPQWDSDLEAQLGLLDVRIDGCLFCVAALRLAAENNAHNRERLMSLLGDVGGRAYLAAELTQGEHIAVLLDMDEAEEREPLVESLTKALLAGGFNPIMGVGRVTSQIGEVNHSLNDAVAAARNACLNGMQSGVCFFEGIEADCADGLGLLPAEETLSWEQALRQANAEEAEACLQKLEGILYAQEQGASREVLRYNMYELARRLGPILAEAGLANGEARLTEIIRMRRLPDFLAGLRALTGEIIAAVACRERQTNQLMIDKILAYVDERALAQSFSLNEVAERFDVTSSYLSRFFRDQMGMNYIDYVTRKRMMQAAALLRADDAPVGEIVGKVGYVDLSSFTRKFSQYFGVSPTKYRKQLAEENDAAKTGGLI